MVGHKHHGLHSKTRHARKKGIREKGMTPITTLLRKFNEGESVHISVNPSQHKGQPYRRFHGKTGVIVAKQGRAYLVQIKDQNATKQVIVSAPHLKRQV